MVCFLVRVVVFWVVVVWAMQVFFGKVRGRRGVLCVLLSEWRVSRIIVVDHVMWASVRKRETFGVILCRGEKVYGLVDVGSLKRREIGARRSSLKGRKKKEASVCLGLW